MKQVLLFRKCPVLLIQNTANAGPAFSRNRGMEAAKGEFLFFIDSDDSMESERIALQVKAMKQNQADVSFGAVTEVDEKGAMIRIVNRPYPKSLRDLRKLLILDELHMSTSTFAMHRSVMESIGAFDERLLHLEDYDYFYRCIQKFEPLYVRRSLARKRVLFSSMSFGVSTTQFLESRQAFFELMLQRDPSVIAMHTAYWAKQYFGLARILQTRGESRQALKCYFRSLFRGNLKSILGLVLTLFPKRWEKYLAGRRWRK